MKSQIYNQAKYYEIAFGFVDQKNKLVYSKSLLKNIVRST